MFLSSVVILDDSGTFCETIFITGHTRNLIARLVCVIKWRRVKLGNKAIFITPLLKNSHPVNCALSRI